MRHAYKILVEILMGRDRLGDLIGYDRIILKPSEDVD
jgi:hypothetical protein